MSNQLIPTWPKRKVIVISGVCCHKGCKRVAKSARKLSDFWVSLCDDHAGRKITLDMDKIGVAFDQAKKLASGGGA
jgi:hypothetical protein